MSIHIIKFIEALLRIIKLKFNDRYFLSLKISKLRNFPIDVCLTENILNLMNLQLLI